MMRTNRKRRALLRAAALLLSLMLSVLSLTGCGYSQIEGSEQELRAVGKVGEYTVHYDELYYLTMTYKAALESAYGENIFDTPASCDLYREELLELVYGSITANYAVLELSDEIGYGESDVQDMVTEDMEELVDSLGGMHDYKKLLYDTYMTDRLMRFTYAVNILESNLLYSYVNYLGLIESEAEEICSIVMTGNTYIRTRHIAIFKDNGRTEAQNRALIEDMKEELDAGGDFDALIDAYSEDEAQDFNGYYFMKGEMPTAYEEAAFSLSIGETSDIVETEDAYFVIRREEKQKEYVLMNCYGEGAPLYDGYQKYTLLAMVEERQSELLFEPNAYGESLDLTGFEQGIFFDLGYMLGVLGGVLVAGGVAALIVWWCVVSIRADRAEKERKKKKYVRR